MASEPLSTHDAAVAPASHVRLRLVLANAAVFTVAGVAMPYWPVWLDSKELSAPVIGVLLGIGPWVRTVLNPLMGQWADRRGNAQRLFPAMASLLLTSYVLLLAFGEGVGLIAGFVVLGAIGFAPLVALLDGIVLRTESADYGRIRLWGSASFIVAGWVVGALLEHLSADVVLHALIVAASLTVLSGLALPRGAVRSGPRGRGAGLLRRPAFRRFIVTAALLQCSHAVLYGFGSIYWGSVGVGGWTIGSLWAVAVTAEIALFYVGTRVTARWSAWTLFRLAALGGVVRWAALAVSTDLPTLFATSVLHALTFAAAHLGAMTYIQREVEPEATSRATTLYSGLATGLAMGVAMPAAGVLYDHYAGGAFWAMALVSGSALLLTFLPRRRG